MEFQRNFEGLTCTCSRNDKKSSDSAVRPKNLIYTKFEDHDVNYPQCKEDLEYKEKHNGSVSLSQIIGSPKCTHRKSTPVRGPNEIHHSLSSPFIPTYHQDYQSKTKDLTSSGSSRYGSSDASPEGIDQHYVFFKKSDHDRPLSDFERDNLLCIQEWKDKQRKILKNLEKQVEDLPHPYFHQRLYFSDTQNQRHSLEELSPREGSPFPRRKEYPPTAFFPSKVASSKALRSLSLEEETEEESFTEQKEQKEQKEEKEQNKEFRNERVWENYTDRFSKISQNGGGRKTWSTSPSQEFSPLNAWWTNISPSPNSGSPINSPSFRRKSSSSLSSYSKSSVAACSTRTEPSHFPRHFESPPSAAKRKFSYRSFSSPAPSGYLSKHLENFNPHDLSYSFANFDHLPKCRPELEDVGGRGGSILSNSSDDEPLVKKTMLPPTAETNREALSDEDTTRKQTDSKLSPNADTTTKTNGSTSSSNNAPTTSPTTTITSSSSSSVNQKVNQCSPNQPTPPQSQNGSGSSDPVSPSPEIRKPSPMAFTVDLDSVNSDSSTSGNSAKKLNISASISQWAPKHKRNLSLTKVEEHKVLDSFFDENGNKPRERRSTISRLEKVDEKQGSEKPPLGRPRSGTVGSCPPGAKRGTAGYHSEGYFSSDQDDDRPNRTDLKSPRSPRTPDTVQAQPLLVRSNSQDSSKGPSVRKFSNTKPEGRTCCKERDRKPSVSELTGKTYKSEKKMGVDSKKPPKSPPIDDYDTSKDEKDDVSEAGTYTIDKDSPTPDEDQARNNIDGVFGITTESEAETTTTTAVPMSTTDQCPEDESSWLSASEIPSSISRSSPNWIQQWAAQVAEQTKPPVESLSSLGKSSISSPRGHSSSLLSQDGNDSRPRRKLPTPPSHLAATSGLSPRSDPPSAKHRGLSKSPSKSSIHKKEGPINRKGAARSNSTLSSKEVDFQNWKRRKNYDPMKAAAEGRKKQVEKKQKNAQPSAQINSDNRSPSPPGSLLRSASFHGTEGVMPHVRWTRKPNNAQPQYTSEDDGPYSLEEEVGPHPSPMHGSPLHRSPTSPHQLCQSPIRHPQVRGSRRPSLGLSDEGEPQYQSGLRKVSLEESGSEGKRSPLNPGARTGSSNSATGAGRPKTKMEALDNLVISTIHSLSVKVRTTSESLLQKLKSQYDEEGDRAALLEEVLSHLSESDQSLTSGQTRSTSRELAGILRNLKKIEHALEVIDKVIIVGEEDYRDDDVDYVPTEWVEESDY